MERRVVTIFGGSGFIGRCLVQKLAAEGWIVRVAVRRPGPAAFLRMFGDPGQVVPVAADVTDRPSVPHRSSMTRRAACTSFRKTSSRASPAKPTK